MEHISDRRGVPLHYGGEKQMQMHSNNHDGLLFLFISANWMGPCIRISTEILGFLSHFKNAALDIFIEAEKKWEQHVWERLIGLVLLKKAHHPEVNMYHEAHTWSSLDAGSLCSELQAPPLCSLHSSVGGLVQISGDFFSQLFAGWLCCSSNQNHSTHG